MAFKTYTSYMSTNDRYTIDVPSLVVTAPDLLFPKKPRTRMQKLTDHLKRILSPDLQAQYKAGFLDSDLTLSERGKRALFDIITEKYQAELTARAKADIAEAEAEKK